MTSLSNISMAGLRAPPCSTGKRSRSNSTSSTTSSSSSVGSVFSQSASAVSVESLSSCSSPVSNKASPTTERPSKVCRREEGTRAANVNTSDTQIATEAMQLTSMVSSACAITAQSNGVAHSQRISSNTKRTLFVDCLVDATVHVLDMIWHAPIHKSISFLRSTIDATHLQDEREPITRQCQCPVGAPLAGGLPLDVFVRETLRRSRTSCSTLQAALLYCKRIGGEVVRQRAVLQGLVLDADDVAYLERVAYPRLQDGRAPSQFPSLCDDGVGLTANQVDLEQIAKGPLLCSRRAFLASVVVSSKFLQDRTYSNRAWSKISGLHVRELGLVERSLLNALSFDFAISETEWMSWTIYLKGDWKKSLDSCRCYDSFATPARKPFDRTISLQVEDLIDLEVSASDPSGSGQTTSKPSPMSTPVQATSNLSSAQQPQHQSQTHRREPSLLCTAVSNCAFSVSAEVPPARDDVHSHVPAPYPMRRGLAVRSISAQ